MKTTIEPLTLESLLWRGRPVEIIDVRTPEEFAETHLHGARSVPLDRLSPRRVLAHRRLPALAPLFVMSGRERRARRAQWRFARAGYGNAVMIDGGLEGCEKSGLFIEHPCERNRRWRRLARRTLAAALALLLIGIMSVAMPLPFILLLLGVSAILVIIQRGRPEERAASDA